MINIECADTMRIRVLLLSLVCLFCFASTSMAQSTDFFVFDSKLSRGLDMGVDSSEQRRDWLSKGEGYMKMGYPSGQDWGAVFITVGKPKDPPRPSRDVSAFKFLIVELKGETGGEQVEVGIKTNKQPDDGSEVKFPVKLTKTWQVFKFPLTKFSVDLRNVYVVAEFVFSGERSQTVSFKGIRYGTEKDSPVAGNAQSGAAIEPTPLVTPESGSSVAATSASDPGQVVPAPSSPTMSVAIVNPIISWIVSLVCGVTVLSLLVWYFLNGQGHDLNSNQEEILRLLMAFSAAFLETFFVGGVILDGTLKSFGLVATGGFVLFILIYFSPLLKNKSPGLHAKQ